MSNVPQNTECSVLGFYSSHPSQLYLRPFAVLTCVLVACLPILSVDGSVLLILAVIKYPQLRTVPSNLLLLSQAVSDLLIGIFVQPLVLYNSLMWDCRLLQNDWLQRFSTLFSQLLLSSSCLNICLITIDRYICIQYCLQYVSIVTEKRIMKAIVASWFFSLLLASLREVPLPETVARLVMALPAAMVLVIGVFCYCTIAVIARRHRKKITYQLRSVQAPSQQEFNSALTTFLMLGVVFVCFVPVTVIRVLGDRVDQETLRAIQPFTRALLCAQFSINPLIFFCRSRKIRKYLWKVIAWLKALPFECA